jgi:hypothetical protein
VATSRHWSSRHSFLRPAELWDRYRRLPAEIRSLADKQFALFRENPSIPQWGFARNGQVWTAEVGNHYRAMARRRGYASSARYPEGILRVYSPEVGRHGALKNLPPVAALLTSKPENEEDNSAAHSCTVSSDVTSE